MNNVKRNELEKMVTKQFLPGNVMNLKLERFCKCVDLRVKLFNKGCLYFQFFDGKTPLCYSIPIAFKKAYEKYEKINILFDINLYIYWLALFTYFEFVDILIKQYELEV